MSTKIELGLEELRDYLERCPNVPFSKRLISVDKEEIFEFLDQLLKVIPSEITEYRKLLEQRANILEEAQKRAQSIVESASAQTNELINEHSIMQHAHSEAEQIISMAVKKGKDTLDEAVIEANQMRQASVNYTDNLMAYMENLTSECIKSITSQYENNLKAWQHYHEKIKADRLQLKPADPAAERQEG